MLIYYQFVYLFFYLVVFYAINLFFPKGRAIKYYLSALFILIGIFGWILVLSRMGGLMIAVTSSYSLIYGVISLLLAFLLDYLMQNYFSDYSKKS